jgi:hypothetical protein
MDLAQLHNLCAASPPVLADALEMIIATQENWILQSLENIREEMENAASATVMKDCTMAMHELNLDLIELRTGISRGNILS